MSCVILGIRNYAFSISDKGDVELGGRVSDSDRYEAHFERERSDNFCRFPSEATIPEPYDAGGGAN